MKQYEAMFLFDPTFGASFENCEQEIRRIMDRAEAEIVFCRTWDERRLAYRIAGRKRGVYVLVYFMAGTDKLTGIERDAKLAEQILRVMVVRAEGVTTEMMERWAAQRGEEGGVVQGGAPAPPAKAEAAPVAKATSDGVDAPAVEAVASATDAATATEVAAVEPAAAPPAESESPAPAEPVDTGES